MSDTSMQEVANNSDLRTTFKQTYPCELCSKILESRGMYTLHMAKHLRPHRCDICGRGFAKRFTLLSHRKTHTGQKDYRCDLCGQAFTLRSQLSKHTVASHPPDGPECVNCGEHFKDSKLLMQHQVYFCRRGKPDCAVGHVCGECGKVFTTALELRSHMRYHSRQYHCVHCEKKFGERSLLRTHLLSAHYDVRPYRCLVCANSFTMKAHCQRHCRLHLRHQNFMCEGCELMFRFEFDLMSHKNKGLCLGKSSDSLEARKLIVYEKPDLDKLGITKAMLGYSPPTGSQTTAAAVGLTSVHQDDEEVLNSQADSASVTSLLKKDKHACSMCDHHFKKAAQLTFHMAQVHGVGTEPFRCCICARGYAFENAMRDHIESHIPYQIYRCEKCGTCYARRRGLEKHKCRSIPGVEPSRVAETNPKNCDGRHEIQNAAGAICDTNGIHSSASDCPSSSSELNGNESHVSESNIKPATSEQTMHVLNSTPEEGTCAANEGIAETGQVDSKVFSTPVTVNVIADTDCDSKKVLVNGVPLTMWCDMAVKASRTKPASSASQPFEGWCSVCQVTINSRHKYNVHMQRHSDTRPFACTECPKTFKTSDNLRAHRRWHDPSRLITCTVCGAQCATASDMRKHQSVHQDAKPFECSMCGKGFRRQVYLSIHERTHTGETPYECEVCGRQFRIQSSLQDHIKIHTGDKPFTCQVCGKRFSQRGNWRAHERRHHGGVRAFSCERCSKSFIQNYELQNHRMRCVVDNFPYTCLLCGMRFIREHPLRRHINRHGCGVCGQQFVVMKEKISHQLRCRRNAKIEQQCA